MGEQNSSASTVYQMRAYLQFLRPIVWRRFIVRRDASIEHLHQVLCCLFDFDSSYPYLFRTATERYSIGFDRENANDESVRRPGWQEETIDEKTVPIKGLVDAVKVRQSLYEKNIFFHIEAPYNVREIIMDDKVMLDLSEQVHFRWGVVINCENELPAQRGMEYPLCTEGKWATPPSCFSDANDYASFLDDRKKLSTRERIESLEEYYGDEAEPYVELVRRGFDPATFDISKINLCLRKIVQE
jgi:hypothetical protein